MRCGPIAIYGYSMDERKLIELATNCARITHSNLLGYNGAVLQCLAIHQALHVPTIKTVADVNAFLNKLIEKMLKVELECEKNELNNTTSNNGNNGSSGGGCNIDRTLTPFTDKLKKVKEMLNNEFKGGSYSVEKIVTYLGNDISALKSVPTAIYAALRCQFALDALDHSCPVVRTLYYSISFGGDTDTIASMACSISGALCGIESIPRILLRHCENNDIMEKLATDLFKLIRCQSA